MSVPATYVFVVAIWSTTPLMIQWSSATMSPIESITLRMLISLAIMTIAAPAMGVRGLNLSKNWKLYLASAIGICPAMPLVYLGSQYIPSGLVSVLFGLSPFFVGLMSAALLKDNSMTLGRYLALGVATTGLAVIFIDGKDLGGQAYIGISLLLMAVAIFATSSIFVKRYASDVNPMQQLLGSLWMACLALVLCWAMFDGELPGDFTTKSLLALLYLGSAGSVLGFLGYFYLIQRISVNLVSLIPLITPALAIWLGYALNGENLTNRLVLGSILIVAGLALFDRFRPAVTQLSK
jgi:drug/metabolite transporter (DMT)-like permease